MNEGVNKRTVKSWPNTSAYYQTRYNRVTM